MFSGTDFIFSDLMTGKLVVSTGKKEKRMLVRVSANKEWTKYETFAFAQQMTLAEMLGNAQEARPMYEAVINALNVMEKNEEACE